MRYTAPTKKTMQAASITATIGVLVLIGGSISGALALGALALIMVLLGVLGKGI